MSRILIEQATDISGGERSFGSNQRILGSMRLSTAANLLDLRPTLRRARLSRESIFISHRTAGAMRGRPRPRTAGSAMLGLGYRVGERPTRRLQRQLTSTAMLF